MIQAPLLFTLVLAAAGSPAQAVETRPTRCQTVDVPVVGEVVERRLSDCGDAFPENVLWHLDRSDSTTGELDGRVTRKTTGRGAVIYVLDWGVLVEHVEFQRADGTNVIAGIDAGGPAVPGCANAALAPCIPPEKPAELLLYGHGTGVASVAAGKNVGVAPDASIVSVLAGGGGTAWAETMRRGLEAIIRHAFEPSTPDYRTAIVNISGGAADCAFGPKPGHCLTAAERFDELILRMVGGVNANGDPDPAGKRFLFVVAAGNYYPDARDQCGPNRSVATYPAVLGTSIEGLLAVGGIDRDNRFWSGSCTGPLVEVAAPAPDIFVASISSSDAYRYLPERTRSGTSWATPYVAGMAARLLEVNPDLTPAQLETMLKTSPSRVEDIPVPVFLEGPRRRSVRH